MIPESNLRYSPSADFSLLGHETPYENRKEGSRGSVEFIGETDDSNVASYRVEIYKARNHGSVGVERSGTFPSFGQVICDSSRLFSVYVPGLAGVPHTEEMNGYASVFKKAAGGEANLVFRNIIREIHDRGEIEKLQKHLEPVLGEPVTFQVKFDPATDVYVDIRLKMGSAPKASDFLPVDLWGTGVMQVTQLFAYIILFRPALLLVDEPDSHLHPSKQKLLARAFETIAEEFDCSIVLSTHSRHLITSASEDANVVWLRDGQIVSSDDRELAELLMEIGALDQFDIEAPEILVCTEDEKPFALEQAVRKLNLESKVELLSINGVGQKRVLHAIKDVAGLLSSAPRIIVHRDRDFLTDEELEISSDEFISNGMEVFCPRLCDVEMYYALPSHVSVAAGISTDQAGDHYSFVLHDVMSELRSKFVAKRRAAIKIFWPDGGGPNTAELWAEGDLPEDTQVYGKAFLATLKKRLGPVKGPALTDYPSEEFVRELSNLIESTP